MRPGAESESRCVKSAAKASASAHLRPLTWCTTPSWATDSKQARGIKVQDGFDPSKKSGVGVDFELLVRSLHVRNKRVVRKPSMIFR